MNLRIEPQQVEQPDTEPLTLHLTQDLLQRLDWACERIIRKDGRPSDRDYTALKYLEAILPTSPKKPEKKAKGTGEPQQKPDGGADPARPKPELAKKAGA